MRRYIFGGRSAIALLLFLHLSTSSETNCPRFVPGKHLYVPEFESSENTTFPDDFRITFSCDAGYRLRGVPTSLCLDGMWFGAVPKCEPLVNCTEPQFEWGGYTGECCSPGDEVKFHCFNRPRFHLSGATSATCLPDGLWNETIPTCQDTYCKDPGFSVNSDRLLMWDKKPYIGDVCCPLQTTAVYSCHQGYELDGESHLQCRKNGTWSTFVPTCKKRTCARFTPGAHLHIEEFEAANVTDFAEGTDINFRCDAGYLLQGDFSATCREGAWAARMPYCEQIRCAPLRSPMHGWMSGGISTAVGAIAKFGCSDGFRLLGSEERRCHVNGLWSGLAVRCVPEAIVSDPSRSSCTDAGDPENGFQDIGAASTILGTFVSFTCYPGYHMLGSPIVLCDSLFQLQSRPVCAGKFFFMHGGDVRKIIQKQLYSFIAPPESLERDTSILPYPGGNDDHEQVRRIVYFLLEASTTIGSKNFHKKINFVKAITRQLKAAPHNRFGIIVCAAEATLVVDPANFSDTIGSLENLHIALHNFSDSDTRFIKDAMTELRSSIEIVKMKFGENIEFVVFFFTDEKLNFGGGAFQSAQGLSKKHDLEIFSLGIAGRSDKAALETFSSLFAKHHLLILRSYDTFQWLADVINAGYSQCGMTAPTPLDKLLERIYEYSFAIARDMNSLRSWPWLVTLSSRDKSSVCGGTIISKKWVMTTGRCVSEDSSSNMFSPADLLVQAKISCPEDASLIDQCAKVNLTVKRIYRHEAYNHAEYFHDISLLELEHELEYDEFVRPACLPAPRGTDSTFYKPGEEALVVTPEPRALYDLRQIKMEIGSQPFCLAKAGNSLLSPGMMCAEYKELGGDYPGAALMLASGQEETMWTQVGISSWVEPKKNNSIRFFSDVSYYLPWIRRHLDGNA